MELKKIREEYNRITLENREFIKLQNKLSRLERKRVIREYRELKENLKNRKYFSNESIIEKLFDYNVIEEIDCNIYVYDGLYKCDIGINNLDEGLYLGGEDCFSYRNLVDQTNYKNIKTNELDDFKDKYVIVNFNDPYNCEKEYSNLRRMYLEKLLKGYSEKEIISSFVEYGMLFGIANINIPDRDHGKILKKSK